MLFPLRASLLLSFALLPLVAVRSSAADNVAKLVQPATAPVAPVAVPAFLDSVSFEFKSEAETHKVTVTSTPTMLRVDEPEDGYSIIYNPQTDFYIGLEHRNYTYWEFSWPQVRDSVENSKRHESRLTELSNEGLNDDNTSPSTNAPASATDTTTASAGGDDSGYVWRPTTERKRISDLDCVRWTGDTISGESVEVWCCNGVLPQVQAAILHLRMITEPIALVPVRTLAPDFIFPVYQALFKGGVTPILITWGDGQDKSHFRFVESKRRDGKISLFIVPKLYMKTTLITMDGMIDQQPAQEPRKAKAPKTWQN